MRLSQVFSNRVVSEEKKTKEEKKVEPAAKTKKTKKKEPVAKKKTSKTAEVTPPKKKEPEKLENKDMKLQKAELTLDLSKIPYEVIKALKIDISEEDYKKLQNS